MKRTFFLIDLDVTAVKILLSSLKNQLLELEFPTYVAYSIKYRGKPPDLKKM